MRCANRAICATVSIFILFCGMDGVSSDVQQLVPSISQQAYLKASNTEAGDSFGLSLAMSGDTIAVGAYREDSNASGVNGNQSNNNAPDSGAAYIFVRHGTTWSQQAYLKAFSPANAAHFGYSIAISGDTVVVGALGEDAAYVFVRNGTNWTQQARIRGSNTAVDDDFGSSVAISGDTIIVGAQYEDSSATGVNGNQNDNGAPQSGAAYVFVRNGTNWSQQAYVKASNTGSGDRFGLACAVSGDTAVIGAHYEDSSAIGVNGNGSNNSMVESGAAYIFLRSGTNWHQQAYLKASNTGAQDRFGRGVAVSGDTVLIGAYQENSNATGVNGDQNNDGAPQSGAAYVFVRSGTNWNQQAYLKASNRPAFFGFWVALSGETAVVGAPYESSSATGVNGNQNNFSAVQAGAGYVFVRSGTTWRQQAYLKASNTSTNHNFGQYVALSGDTVVISAIGEDSNATGVDGNQTNFAAPDSGAAYVFTGVGIGPTLRVLSGSGYSIRLSGHVGFSYRLQRATSLAGPWDTVATKTAPLSGLIEFDGLPEPMTQYFYRTAQP